jgi:two-component sensor histidine kinase
LAPATTARYERELALHRSIEAALRQSLARDEELLHQRDRQIEQQTAVGEETVHRLLNGLQIVASLLSMQSRASANKDTASRLAEAAHRVAMVSRIHRRLHDLSVAGSIAFKPYLQEVSRDYAAMLSTAEQPVRISVDAIDVDLAAKIAIPLTLVVNELITNAAKYGAGRISISLRQMADQRYALCVSNDGPALPKDFDPALSKGLGMRIVRTFVDQIDGEFQFGCADQNQGAKFSVLFPATPQAPQQSA